MRLFAALLPPEPVRDQLAVAAERLHALPGADRLRWTERNGWHITLAFYGEVPEDVRPGLEARLCRAARRHRRFPLSLSGGGRFGDRALWADVAGERDTLVRLAGSAAAAGRREKVGEEETRTYRPHLTLARNRDRVDLRPYAEALADCESEVWEAAELTLMRSLLPVSGVPGEQPRYETVTAWPLGG